VTSGRLPPLPVIPGRQGDRFPPYAILLSPPRPGTFLCDKKLRINSFAQLKGRSIVIPPGTFQASRLPPAAPRRAHPRRDSAAVATSEARARRSLAVHPGEVKRAAAGRG
jgi:hypothetical protein